MKRLFLFIIIILTSHPIYAQLYINEFMASNNQAITDEFGEYDDWIEIYNDYEYAVDLSGFYLTEHLDNPTKWAFPDITIAAKDYLLIWADDSADQGELHTNFRLNAEVEQIGLYDGSNFIDSLTFGQQMTNISYGRYPDGSENWHYFSEPSPNAANNGSIIEFAEAPMFSVPGGFYSAPVTVELSADSPTATIYYTLDCYEPTQQSELYTGPIFINKTTIVRAKTFEDGHYPSKIKTTTYFINTDHELNAISLVTNPPSLWDPDSGIYENPEKTGDLWERYASAEYFGENNNLIFSENVGLRIHGSFSRNWDKKSFRLYFRPEYGLSWLQYPLFESKDIDEFKRIVLGGGSSDSPGDQRDYFYPVWAFIRDILMQDLNSSLGGLFAGKKYIYLFLNGEPWGVYYLSEYIDKYYLKTNVDAEDSDLIEDNKIVKEGTIDEWNNLMSFFENTNFSKDSNVDEACQLIDIENYINYFCVEIYGGNRDWPHNNILCYRPRSGKEPWRWIMWDGDYTFGSPSWVPDSYNTLFWAIDDATGHFILRKLLENKNFKNKFVNRFADLLNSLFTPESVIAKIDSLAALVAPGIPFEVNRWGTEEDNLDKWERNVEGIREFARRRQNYIREHIIDQLGTDNCYELVLNSPQGGSGTIRVNTLMISNYPWSGYYFEDYPFEIEAMPARGYLFKEWSDPTLPKTAIVTLSLTENYSVYPIFEEESVPHNIVITEINFNSAADFNPGDWIEIYNLNDETIDLGGWHLRDDNEDNVFDIPDGITINPHEFLILCNDQEAFLALLPDVSNVIGDFKFNFSNGGDDVKLFSPGYSLIDSVTYNDKSPWPIGADGTGATLELLDPVLDNSLPENWQASAGHGSPGNLTLAIPVVTSFAVKDKSGSTELTHSRDILITMTESDYDGNVIKWHVNEDSLPPSPSDFSLTSRSINYHIQGTEGNVIIYAWVLDNDNQISRLTPMSQDTIQLALSHQEFVIAGTVNYKSKVQPVVRVIMTLTDSFGTNSDTTDTNGNYAFSILEPGNVKLSANSRDENQAAITGSDALLVLQYLAFLTDMSDDNKLAADVTEDGNVTGADALAILRYLAFYADNIGSTGQWRFQPPDSSFTLNADTTIDFRAYLLGDANLSWVPTGQGMAKTALYSNISLEIDPVIVPQGEYIEVPLRLATNNEVMNTLQFSLEYDAEQLQFQSIIPVPVIEKFLIEANGTEPGTVHVAMAGLEGIKSTTEILRFRFKVIAPSLNNQSAKLTLVRILANDRIVNTGTNGEIQFSEAMPEIIPENFALFHNYPNPFNANTQIEFQLPQSAQVSIIIYNLRGNEIRTILNENKPAGSYRVTWDGKDNHGTVMSSGIYMVQLKSDGFVQCKKMIMMK